MQRCVDGRWKVCVYLRMKPSSFGSPFIDFLKLKGTEDHTPQVGVPKPPQTLTEEEERELNELMED